MKHKITFDKIHIRNFLSVNDLTFDFQKHSGLNYVFGTNKDIPGTKNGSGKSAVFCDSLLFGLFGKTIRDINKQYIAHRQISAKTDVEVEVWFHIGPDAYYVSSGLEMPGKGSFFKLSKNLTVINKPSIKELRTYFENEILRSSFEMFKNSIVLSSQESNKFLALPKGAKRNLIESIFKLYVFGEMLKKIRSDANSISKEILVLQNTIKQLVENIESYQTSANKFEKEKETELSVYREKLEFKKKRTKELEDELTKLESSKNSQSKSVLSVSDLEKKIQKIKTTAIKVEGLIQMSRSTISHNETLIKKYGTVFSNVCKDCTTKLRDKLNIASAEASTKEEEEKIRKCQDAKEKFDETKKKFEKELADAKIIAAAIEEIDKKIQHNQQVVDHLKHDIEDLEERQIETTAKKSPFDDMIKDTEAKLADEKEKMKSRSDKNQELEILQHIVSENGAKKFIIIDLIDILNVRIRKYLDEMGARFTCVFDDSFNCEFLTESGPCSYENFSCGEKTRIDIAILLAFKDMLTGLGSLESSILVLDEFIDSALDDFSINAIIKILKNLNENAQQTIFVISHRLEVGAEDFDNVIEVQKNNGFSEIVDDKQATAI